MLSKSGVRRHNKIWRIALANAKFREEQEKKENLKNTERKEPSYYQIKQACKKWFKEFLNINVTIAFNKIYLEIDNFSIEISNDEIIERAKQYLDFKQGKL